MSDIPSTTMSSSLTHLKPPLTAPLAAAELSSPPYDHTTSLLANSLLILLRRPISTCVWFWTTVSVTLRPSLVGQGGAPDTLLSGRQRKQSAGRSEGEMGSERRAESIASSQTKGERGH